MFYGSTVEHRQGSMISDPHESRSAMYTDTPGFKPFTMIIYMTQHWDRGAVVDPGIPERGVAHLNNVQHYRCGC